MTFVLKTSFLPPAKIPHSDSVVLQTAIPCPGALMLAGPAAEPLPSIVQIHSLFSLTSMPYVCLFPEPTVWGTHQNHELLGGWSWGWSHLGDPIPAHLLAGAGLLNGLQMNLGPPTLSTFCEFPHVPVGQEMGKTKFYSIPAFEFVSSFSISWAQECKT